MTDEAKRIVCDLRRYAQRYADPYYCGGKLIDGTARLMEKAADMIEKLYADLESDERQYGRNAVAILADEGAKLEADRDTWKRRCEAAERDINAMLRAHVDDMHCDQCVKSNIRESCQYYGKDMCTEAVWRGPCSENGGSTNA